MAIKIPVTTGMSVKEMQAHMKSSGGGGGDQRLLMLSDGDNATIRFLQEVEDWVTYREHYTVATGFVPCVEDCDLCEQGVNSSEKSLVNVFVYENEQVEDKKRNRKARILEPKKVMLLKMSGDLKAAILSRADRRGTICDRTVVISRMGSGASDTKYTPDWADERSKAPKISGELLDAMEYLEDQVKRYLGNNVTSDKSKKKSTNIQEKNSRRDDDDDIRKKKRKSKYEEEEDEDDDIDEDDEEEDEEIEEFIRPRSKNKNSKGKRK